MSRPASNRADATRWLLALGLLLAALPAGVARGQADPLRLIRTDHYLIHTDLDDALASDLARRMEAMYGEYARRFAGFHVDDPSAPRLEAYLFKSQQQYLEFTGQRLKNTGGVYMPHRNLLAAFLEGQGRDGLRRTLQHEAFHQFAYNAISPNLPVWLNEGLAQMFEEGIWDGSSFWIGQAPPRRIRQLRADLAQHRLIGFPTLLAMTPEQWSANLAESPDLGAAQYNQSWAMVYFLVHAKGPDGKGKYRSRLLGMLRLLHEGRSADEAFRESFSSNIHGFQDRFMEWAQSLQATDEATMIERQSVLGDLLAELSKRGKHFADMYAFKRSAITGGYRMHYAKGGLQWDTNRNLATYFADIDGRPLGPDDLHFEPDPDAPLPDIICRLRGCQIRTRFYGAGDKLEHEVLVEPPVK